MSDFVSGDEPLSSRTPPASERGGERSEMLGVSTGHGGGEMG